MNTEQATLMLGLLERIAVALEAPAVAPDPPQVDAGCPHPEKARVTFGLADEWECRSCGYRSPALVAGG